MIKGQIVTVVNGSGGPSGNSIPVYNSKKMEKGGWAYEIDSVTQLMWPNGKKLVRVNPDKLEPGDNFALFFKFNGEELVKNIVAARVWLYNEETKSGDDWKDKEGNKIETWVEDSHLLPTDDPELEGKSEQDLSGLYDFELDLGGLKISGTVSLSIHK